jgi:hypothetical protein
MTLVRSARAVTGDAAAPPARSAPVHARARPAIRAAATISDALGRAIRAFAERGAQGEPASRDADVTGLFGQAINAGIHALATAHGEPADEHAAASAEPAADLAAQHPIASG